MPKLDKEALIQQDIDRASTSLKNEGKKPDAKRLATEIRDDWEILSRARLLPESVKAEITRAVGRIIKSHRALAQKVLPAEALKGNPDFYRLLLAVNTSLAQQKENSPISDLDIDAISRTKRMVAKDIIQPKIIHHVDQMINETIDGNDDKSLEEVIEQVIAYLKNECLGKNATSISFYLVNEENYHEQTDNLTKTTVGIPVTPVTRQDFESGKEQLQLFTHQHEKPRRVIDHETNKQYFELKVKGHQLGYLEIDLKPGTELSSVELEYVEQALTRLDSKIDEALHSKRLDIVARKAHRILDEHGTTEDFEQGIAEFMELVCLYSTAYEAEVMVDIFGDGQDWFANRFNDDREITPIEMDNGMKAEIKIPSNSRRVDEKRALVLDITDSTSTAPDGAKNIIGKVIFRTQKDADELTNEDHTMLNLCSEILSSHILKWRNDLKLRTEGVDPQIARTTMRGGIQDMVKETLSTFYTDIAGYTYICEILEDAFEGEETMQDIETLKAVLEEFLKLIQRTGQMYGGVWDKAVGDMGLMEFGVPIDRNGIDPLGDDSINRHPEFFANNALKAAILVRKGLSEVSAVFRKKLLEIAVTKYSEVFKELSNEKPEESDGIMAGIIEKLGPEEQNIFLKKLESETGLSPKITTTTSVYTGQGGYMKLKLGAAHDWTGIGNAMNSAARVQGTSLKMEIRVPLLTRDLVMPLMNNDRQVPYNKNGDSESWAEFFHDKLGLDPEKVKVDFVEYYEGYKNKAGRNVVFTVNIMEESREKIMQGTTLSIQELLKYEGEEFGIVGTPKAGENNTLTFKLKTLGNNPSKSVTFRVNIPQAAIDERVTRYKSPQALKKRAAAGSINSLLVQSGKLKLFNWESIEVDQNRELSELRTALQRSNEKIIVFTKMVPTGCYQLNEETDHADRDHKILSLRKDNDIFDVRVSTKKILEGPAAIMRDTEVLYDFQAYYETIRGKTTPGKPIIFVRKRNFYKIDPIDAENYLMPIITRPETVRNSPNRHLRISSNPPPAGTSILPPPESAYATSTPLKTPLEGTSKFWTKMSEQISSYQSTGKQTLVTNWNNNFEQEQEQEQE